MSTNGQAGASLSPLKQAIVEIRALKQRVAELERAGNEPIALVGMGFRLPGGCDTPEAFWQLLAAGEDAVGPIPADRWDIEEFYDADPDAPGKMYTRHGGFLERDRPIRRRSSSAIAPREADPDGSRSSVCCSRWPGKRWRTPARRPNGSRAARAACLSGSVTATICVCWPAIPSRSMCISLPAAPPASPPAASRICSASMGRPWRSTPRARRRWWRCTSPAQPAQPRVRPGSRRRRQPDLDAGDQYRLLEGRA